MSGAYTESHDWPPAPAGVRTTHNHTRHGGLGHADWLYDSELDAHIPACIVETGPGRRCGNGPLNPSEIPDGNCGKHGPISRTHR